MPTSITNVEIKARCPDPDAVRARLKQKEADYRGCDHQTDTYFQVSRGRLKLRDGTIESSLIYYQRPDSAQPKTSRIELARLGDAAAVLAVLRAALPVLTVVDKTREIYFIDNVKFHIDHVGSLGWFVEIEAIDEKGQIGEDVLRRQCRHYMELFGIEEDQLVDRSYSDMMLEQPG